MDVWSKVTRNWGELCVAMGCTQTRIPNGIAHSYPIGRSGPFYNLALVGRPHSRAIEEAERVFDENELPFIIVIPRLATYAEMERSLVDLGYSLPPAWGLMIHERMDNEVKPEIEVDSIDRSKLNEWFALQDVFPHVRSSKKARLEMIERILENSSARLLLATINGKSVGAGLLYMKRQIASIHMIATRPDFRRRHVATTITLAAVSHARNEKADLIWLRTRRGGIGEKVYTKIGFNVFLDILSYTKTLEHEDSNLPPK